MVYDICTPEEKSRIKSTYSTIVKQDNSPLDVDSNKSFHALLSHDSIVKNHGSNKNLSASTPGVPLQNSSSLMESPNIDGEPPDEGVTEQGYMSKSEFEIYKSKEAKKS